MPSRNSADCLEMRLSRPRYSSAASPVQSGSRPDAAEASMSSRRRSVAVSLALINAWLTWIPRRQRHGAPGCDAAACDIPFSGIMFDKDAFGMFMTPLEHVPRHCRHLCAACGRRTSKKHAVGVSSLENQRTHADGMVDNFCRGVLLTRVWTAMKTCPCPGSRPIRSRSRTSRIVWIGRFASATRPLFRVERR